MLGGGRMRRRGRWISEVGVGRREGEDPDGFGRW